MGWTIRDRIPVGTRISARPDRHWCPPSLMYNGYRVFPGVRFGRGVLLTTHPLLVPRSTHTLGHTGPVTGTLNLFLPLLCLFMHDLNILYFYCVFNFVAFMVMR